MSFAGKYELESQDNYEEFLEAIGMRTVTFLHSDFLSNLPKYRWTVWTGSFVLLVTDFLKAKTDHKVVTEVIQDGDHFTWTQSIPNWTWTSTFTVGEESELVSMKGQKFTVSSIQFAKENNRFASPLRDRLLVAGCSNWGGREGFTPVPRVPLHSRNGWWQARHGERRNPLFPQMKLRSVRVVVLSNDPRFASLFTQTCVTPGEKGVTFKRVFKRI